MSLSLFTDLAVFVLSLLLGIEVISKVPVALHTPLMSGANAIHGIVVVGAVLVTAAADSWWAYLLGGIACFFAAANAIDEGSTVGPSQRLLLPGRDSAEDPAPPAESTHVVRAGDTLTSVAHRYHVPLAEIRKLNPSAGARTLHPGDRLRIRAIDAD